MAKSKVSRIEECEKAIKPEPEQEIIVCWCATSWPCEYHKAHPEGEYPPEALVIRVGFDTSKI
jgi:hypothetical protein